MASQAPHSFHGYEIVEAFAPTWRFATYKLRKGGREYFGKRAVTANLSRELESEVWFNLTLDRLNQAVPNLGVTAPAGVEAGRRWYVREWVDGRFLVEENGSAADVRPHVTQLAGLLQRLDAQLLVSPHGRATYENPSSSLYSDLLSKVDKWLKRPLKDGYITHQRTDLAIILIKSHLKHLKPSFQHGDFVPWHILVDQKGDWHLIDGEHSSLLKPRYYDLAYVYTRLSTRLKAQAEAARLLELFLQGHGVPKAEFYNAFLPVVTLRALGMHHDAWADREAFDYKAEAAALLDRCFAGDLSAFLPTR
jgi:aminoglycoside phosphotransferase (APT) family kinase protein